jgi:two-component system, LuxR family, response regulator FixJ
MPASLAQMIQLGSPSANAVISSAVRPTIYVVDDDTGVLNSLRFLLETDGFDVHTFRSGTALLSATLAAGIDCFVVDYKLSDINGIDLIGRLRSRGVVAPAILITGYPDPNISARAASAGVKHVLNKPLLDESLIKHIQAAIQPQV